MARSVGLRPMGAAAVFALLLGGPHWCLAEGLLAISNPAKNGAPLEGFATTDVFQANDNVAMRDYGGQWLGSYGTRSGENVGFVFARAQVGVQWQGYRVAALRRGDALVKATRDTTDLVHQYQTKNGYETGRAYVLDYSLRGFEAEGLSISKSWQTDWGSQWELRSGAGLSYLRGTKLKLESATGQVIGINAKDVNAVVASDSSNSFLDTTKLAEFNAPYGRQAPFSGEGYSVDVGVVLQNTHSGVRIEAILADLAGQMAWKNVPTNLTNYNTASKYYDADGYVQFNPTATRTSSYKDFTQALPVKAHIALVYPWRNWEVEGSTGFTQGIFLPEAALGYRLAGGLLVKASHDFRFGTYGISVGHAWFQVALRTDSADLGAAKAYGMHVKLQIPI